MLVDRARKLLIVAVPSSQSPDSGHLDHRVRLHHRRWVEPCRDRAGDPYQANAASDSPRWLINSGKERPTIVG
jgi:hypothetical protein